MGTLAKIKRIIRPLGPVRAASPEDGEPVIERGSTSAALTQKDEPKDDLGEVVTREGLEEVIARSGVGKAEDHNAVIDEDEDEETVQVKKAKKKRKPREAEAQGNGDTEGKTEVAATKRPKKKRKKGGDAFDDLFSSLI